MGDPDRIQAERASLDSAVDAFNDYAKRFENTLYPLGTCHNNLATGAGEFAGDIASGNAVFLLGWRESMQACSETTGIIAGNIGGFQVDLTDVDIDHTVSVTI